MSTPTRTAKVELHPLFDPEVLEEVLLIRQRYDAEQQRQQEQTEPGETGEYVEGLCAPEDMVLRSMHATSAALGGLLTLVQDLRNEQRETKVLIGRLIAILGDEEPEA